MSEFFPTCQDIFLTVAPGAEDVRAANAETLAIIAATAPFEIAFDTGVRQFADAGLTYQGRPAADGRRPRFSQLRFFNPNAFPIDIRVQVSTGEIFDNRAIFGGNSVPVAPAPLAVFDVAQSGPWSVAAVQSGPWSVGQGGAWNVGQSGVWNVGLTGTYLPRDPSEAIVSGSVVSCAGGGAVTLVAPANADRRSVSFDHEGTETVFLKTSSGASNSGIALRPGERIEVKTTGLVHARNNASFAQTIRYVENRWV